MVCNFITEEITILLLKQKNSRNVRELIQVKNKDIYLIKIYGKKINNTKFHLLCNGKVLFSVCIWLMLYPILRFRS